MGVHCAADLKGEQHIPHPVFKLCRRCCRRVPSSPCGRCDGVVCICHCDDEHCLYCPGCRSTVESRAAEPSCGWGFFPGGPGRNTFFKKELVRRRRLKIAFADCRRRLKIAFADWKGEQQIPHPGCKPCRRCCRSLPSSPCVRCGTAVCIRCLIWCRHCDDEHCRHCPGCPGLNARSSRDVAASFLTNGILRLLQDHIRSRISQDAGNLWQQRFLQEYMDEMRSQFERANEEGKLRLLNKWAEPFGLRHVGGVWDGEWEEVEAIDSF